MELMENEWKLVENIRNHPTQWQQRLKKQKSLSFFFDLQFCMTMPLRGLVFSSALGPKRTVINESLGHKGIRGMLVYSVFRNDTFALNFVFLRYFLAQLLWGPYLLW